MAVVPDRYGSRSIIVCWVSIVVGTDSPEHFQTLRLVTATSADSSSAMMGSSGRDPRSRSWPVRDEYMNMNRKRAAVVKGP
jgi:hypothetical protein